MVTTFLGLLAFASGIERYLLRRATILETVLLWLAALGLFWPQYWADIAGFCILALVIVLQRFYTCRRWRSQRSSKRDEKPMKPGLIEPKGALSR